MLRLINRLTWNDLSIRAKIGVILTLMLALIGIVTAVTASLLGSLGSQVRAGVATAAEIRSLSQQIQLSIETLQRVQVRLVEEYSRPGFDPGMSTLQADYSAEAAQLTEQDIPRLQELTLGMASGERRPVLEAEFRTFQSGLADSIEDFNQTWQITTELTDPATGSLVMLDANGDALDALSAQLFNRDLEVQIAIVRSLERSLIETGANQDLLDLRQAVQSYRITYQANRVKSPEAEGLIDSYLDEIDRAARLRTQLDLAHRSALTSLSFLRDSGSRLANIANDEASSQIVTIERVTATAARPLIYGALLELVLFSALMVFFGRTIMTSIRRLLETARRFEQGNFRARVHIDVRDEFSQLARSFNTMASQLDELVGGLETRVAERTRDLSITAEIGQAVLVTRDPRDLMQEVVELIRDRFDFYHAQVFIVDDVRENARLIASTGQVGRELLARRHSLAVGSQSVIGQVTATGASVIALDTDTSVVHRRNELLPDTRSEMALPMRIGNQVIGALDVQSVAPNAFDQDTVAVFQIMADQLAMALENARLHTQLQDAMGELENLEHRITSEAWRAYQRSRTENALLGYEMHGEVILPRDKDVPTTLQDAIQQGRVVTRENNETEFQLALPIKVRGEVIGAFGFGGEALRNLSNDDIMLLEAVIDRVGLALENMRLVEQTARRAEYEQIVNDITAKIVGSTDINFILQTTVKELGRALRAPQTSVQLRKETAVESGNEQ